MLAELFASREPEAATSNRSWQPQPRPRREGLLLRYTGIGVLRLGLGGSRSYSRPGQMGTCFLMLAARLILVWESCSQWLICAAQFGHRTCVPRIQVFFSAAPWELGWHAQSSLPSLCRLLQGKCCPGSKAVRMDMPTCCTACLYTAILPSILLWPRYSCSFSIPEPPEATGLSKAMQWCPKLFRSLQNGPG